MDLLTGRDPAEILSWIQGCLAACRSGWRVVGSISIPRRSARGRPLAMAENRDAYREPLRRWSYPLPVTALSDSKSCTIFSPVKFKVSTTPAALDHSGRNSRLGFEQAVQIHWSLKHERGVWDSGDCATVGSHLGTSLHATGFWARSRLCVTGKWKPATCDRL